MKPRELTILFRLAACALTVGWSAQGNSAPAADFSESFESGAATWQVRHEQAQARIVSHRREGSEVVGGEACEKLAVEAAQPNQVVLLEHRLPAARVIDDLKLTVWVRSNLNGAELALRVVFPRQHDPRTGKNLTMVLRGGKYNSAGKWQQLQATALEKDVREQLVLLRYRLNNPHLDWRDLYVDQAVLTAPLVRGSNEILIDELRFGPIVSPDGIEPVVHQREEKSGRDIPPVEFRLDRLLVEERPFFPRIVPYHSEDPGLLQHSGVNVVWIPDFQDAALLGELRQRGLWTMATPPRATSPVGEVLDDQNASLVPFSHETAPIIFWYLGTRIGPQAQQDLIAWNQQIRGADRRFNRPLMADVTGLERVYSRHLALLGVSRHVLNTTFSLKQYRDWLLQRRKLSLPGSFVWTWIQTEAASAHVQQRQASQKHPIVIEPEQIRLQAYAALAAGCRGIGFWKTVALDESVPGAFERRLAITQLNLELDLLEPWLATGNLDAHVPFQLELPRTAEINRRRLDFRTSEAERNERDALLRIREDRLKRGEQTAGELQAAIIQSDQGLLILPMWYEEEAQFVPGQLAANNLTIVVPGADESASAWELSTTDIRSLTRRRVAGGIEITLPKFDQTAVILLSSDRAVIARLRSKIQAIAEKSARACIDLAKAKRQRVQQIDAELHSLGVGQPDAPHLLESAAHLILKAEAAFEQKEYHDARQHSADALQLVRILQRAHFNDAVRSLSHPVSSPHTISFQTLPDHWRMVAEIGRSLAGAESNLLASGDFEDIDTMVGEGWRHAQTKLPGIRAAAELYPDAHRGKYALRLIAVPETGVDPPAVITDSPVTVTTPPVTVRSGQIVHVSGWIRIVAPTVGTLDGAVLYDSLTGPVGALRWRENGSGDVPREGVVRSGVEGAGWQRFQLIREVQESGPFTLTFALSGLGELQLDDLSIIPHDPRNPAVASDAAPSTSGKNPRSKAFDFLTRFPKLNPLAPAKN